MSDNNYGLGGHPDKPLVHLSRLGPETADIVDGPTQFSATRRGVKKITVFPMKAFASNKPTLNSGNVYVGMGATNLPVKLVPSADPKVYTAVDWPLDLSDLHFLVETDGDGIYVEVEGEPVST